MTHRILLAASAFAALAAAAPAFAQDEKPLWTGFYIGANAGWTWGNTNHRFLTTPGTGAIVIPPDAIDQIDTRFQSNPGGFTGGGEAGYNWLNGNLVLGLETDFDYLDMKATRTIPFNSSLVVNPLIVPPTTLSGQVGQGTKADWLWTVRPRLGYATGSWLFYVTGGFALADIKLTSNYSDDLGNVGSASTSSTRAGWTVGGGIGYAISPSWSVKAEYLYADFGSVNQAILLPNGFGSIISQSSPRTNIARFGVDYRF
jgi:outer membrane immunogenic protein